jgi:hypothetical protein
VEGEGQLSKLISLRDDIIRGDLRALYLAWLKAAYWESGLLEDDEDLPEPPVPPNLKRLSVPLQDFVDFFEIDSDLIAAASEASPSIAQKPEQLEKCLDLLPEAEQKTFLIRLLNGESHLDVELTARLRELSSGGQQAETSSAVTRRGIVELIAGAEERARIRTEKARKEAEQARIRRLNELTEKEPAVWDQIFALIEQKKAKAYDEAVRLLVQLRELAEYKERRDAFDAKIHKIHEDYQRLRALRDRMDRSGLK